MGMSFPLRARGSLRRCTSCPRPLQLSQMPLGVTLADSSTFHNQGKVLVSPGAAVAFKAFSIATGIETSVWFCTCLIGIQANVAEDGSSASLTFSPEGSPAPCKLLWLCQPCLTLPLAPQPSQSCVGQGRVLGLR